MGKILLGVPTIIDIDTTLFENITRGAAKLFFYHARVSQTKPVGKHCRRRIASIKGQLGPNLPECTQ